MCYTLKEEMDTAKPEWESSKKQKFQGKPKECGPSIISLRLVRNVLALSALLTDKRIKIFCLVKVFSPEVANKERLCFQDTWPDVVVICICAVRGNFSHFSNSTAKWSVKWME